jgi:hypothetical protein
VPLKVAKQGDSLQSMASANGNKDWQSIASKNGIEDPLRISPGQFVNLRATATLGLGLPNGSPPTPPSLDAMLGGALSGSVGVGGGSLNASLGGAASGSLSLG